MYKDRASILADIKKHCYGISAVIDKGKQGKILVKINDDNPREIEVIDMKGMFCILIRYEKNKPAGHVIISTFKSLCWLFKLLS